MKKNSEKIMSSVLILGSKVKIIDELKEEFSTENVGRKIPIGGLLVAALEYLREDLRSKKLTIEYKDYDCKIIKSL
jgi:hypothetical protein